MAERMIETSPVPDVIDTFVDRLRNRPNLAGVSIWSAPADMTGEGEYIMVLTCSEDVEAWAAGRARDGHAMTITCGLLVTRPGAGDQVATDVRRRAGELLGEIEKELRTTAGNALVNASAERTVRFATLPRREWDQGFSKGSRWCSVEFDVTAKATTARA